MYKRKLFTGVQGATSVVTELVTSQDAALLLVHAAPRDLRQGVVGLWTHVVRGMGTEGWPAVAETIGAPQAAR